MGRETPGAVTSNVAEAARCWKTPPSRALAIEKTGCALPSAVNEVDVYWPTIRPWLVFAIHARFIGPKTRWGALQVAPPSRDETKPKVSWHVLELQLLTG